MDEITVRYYLQHIYDQYNPYEQQRFPERFLIFRAMQYIAYAKYMLKKDYPLIAEPVIQEIDHITWAGLKAEFPEKQLVIYDSFHARTSLPAR